jgi:hypothetical protein
MRATNFKTDNSVEKTTFQYMKDGDWTDAKTDRQAGDTFSIGNVELAVGAVSDSGQSVEVWNNSEETNFNTLYSAEGLKVFLPYDNVAAATGAINITGANPATWQLVMVEEDKDGDIAQGDWINATIGLNSQSPAEVQVSSYTTSAGGADATEIEDTDVYEDWTYSALATKILNDRGPNQYNLELIYHGGEVAADVYITSSDAVISGEGGEAGVMTVTDSEVSTVAGKNLIVVGGSAINSVAAELLGGAYREAEFTSMTGVASGEFLIESFNRAGKTALLVAGYNAADTTKAATYLTNNDVDTTVGMKYKGTSATEASLVVA